MLSYHSYRSISSKIIRIRTSSCHPSIPAVKILLSLGADINGVRDAELKGIPVLDKGYLPKHSTPLYAMLKVANKNFLTGTDRAMRIPLFPEEHLFHIALYLRACGGIVYPPLDREVDAKALGVLYKIDRVLFEKPNAF